MTTIAVNKNMMAGDKQFTHSSGMIIKGRTKIYEVPEYTCQEYFDCNRAFLGFAGNADDAAEVIQWIHYPEGKAPRTRNIELLMLTSDKRIMHGTSVRNWLLIDQPFFSIGTGMQYAIGAMTAGKTPYEAVKVAAKHDANTGKGFNKLEM